MVSAGVLVFGGTRARRVGCPALALTKRSTEFLRCWRRAARPLRFDRLPSLDTRRSFVRTVMGGQIAPFTLLQSIAEDIALGCIEKSGVFAFRSGSPSCKRTCRRARFTRMRSLYSINPSFRKRFIKKLTFYRVAPMMFPSASWEILGISM